MITPIRQDKRYHLVAGTVAAVLMMSAANRPPSEQILTFIGSLVLGFIGQSQWGQTKRMTTPAPPPAAEAPKP